MIPSSKIPASITVYWLASQEATSAQDIESRGLRLSESERQRLDGMTKPERRKEFLLSRYLLRLAAQDVLSNHGLEVDDLSRISLSATRGEPPKLLQPSGVHIYLSLTHSGHAIAAAASMAPMAIDIEQPNAKRNFKRLAEHYFHPEELRQLQCLSGEAASEWFYRCWTAKEAVLKVNGRGLDLGKLNQICLRADPDYAELLTTTAVNPYLFALALPKAMPIDGLPEIKVTAVQGSQACLEPQQWPWQTWLASGSLV